MSNKRITKNELLLYICVIVAVTLIIPCVWIVELLGVYLGSVSIIRFVFGIGIFIGIILYWLAQVFALRMEKK